MTGTRIYPAADARTQWFADTWPGDVMPHPNVVVLHTTESASWPGYSGGAVAPTFTVWPGHGVRQHFPVDVSARALVNAPGGVQTNTLNVVQVELVGTCAAGGPGLFWPGAAAADLAELAALLRWLAAEWPIPLTSTPKPWLPYPKSYGSAGGQRMGFAEWDAFSGVCGHQHVPENDHGDPGAFPINLALSLARASVTPSAQENTMTPQEIAAAVWGAPLTSAYDGKQASAGDLLRWTNAAAGHAADALKELPALVASELPAPSGLTADQVTAAVTTALSKLTLRAGA